MMIDTEVCSILTVCLPEAKPTDLPMWRATTASEALSILRMTRIDLLLTGLAVPDMSPWQLVRRVRASARAPRWALIASELSIQDEIEARALGATAVLHWVPNVETILTMLAAPQRATVPDPHRAPRGGLVTQTNSSRQTEVSRVRLSPCQHP